MWNYFIYRNAWRYARSPHEEQKLGKDACTNLLSMGGMMVRNTYDFDCQEETSFWYIIKDQFFGFEELTSRCRNKIRRANNNYTYRILENKEFEDQGNKIYEKVMLAYGNRNESLNDFLSSSSDCENIECWGCFLKGTEKMIGFAVNYLWDDACGYELLAILPEYKHTSTYPYYGLIYAMNEFYLGKMHLKYVSDGSRTITQHSDIQDFLIQHFNFRKAYCQLAVHYCWWMKIAVKMLYPFRKIMPLQRVKAILNMEAMQRGEK